MFSSKICICTNKPHRVLFALTKLIRPTKLPEFTVVSLCRVEWFLDNAGSDSSAALIPDLVKESISIKIQLTLNSTFYDIFIWRKTLILGTYFIATYPLYLPVSTGYYGDHCVFQQKKFASDQLKESKNWLWDARMFRAWAKSRS